MNRSNSTRGGAAGGRGGRPYSVAGFYEKAPDVEPPLPISVRLSNWAVNQGGKYFFFSLWLAANAVLFVLVFLQFNTRPDLANVRLVVGLGLPIARAGAACVMLNCALLLFPVCRNIMSVLRNTFLNRLIPFDMNIAFHKTCAWGMLFFALVHIYAHYFNYENIAITVRAVARANATTILDFQSIQVLQKAFLNDARTILVFTGTGITGVVAFVCQLLMYSSAVEAVRRKQFEFFWYTHHLFIIFFIMLIIHGMFAQVSTVSAILNKQTASTKFTPSPTPPYSSQFYQWIIPTGFLYTCERLWREIRGRKQTTVHKVVLHPGKVCELQVKKPSFRMRAGQYIFLNCPEVSFFQWHPFTLTSAPEEDYVSVHMRIVGDFTTAIAKRLGCKIDDDAPFRGPLPRIMVDGPYGSASEDVFKYEVVMLFGAGIGVTPFASILKSIWYRVINPVSVLKVKKVYFFWVSRDKQSFEWFQDLLAALEEEDIDHFLEIHAYVTGGMKLEEIRNITLNDEAGVKDALTGLRSPTHYGRPNFDAIFKTVAENHPSTDVGVFFCGPKPISHQLARCSNQYTDTRVGGTKFYYNKENF